MDDQQTDQEPSKLSENDEPTSVTETQQVTDPTTPQLNPTNSFTPTKKSSRKKLVMTLLFALLLIAVGAGAWFLLAANSDEEETSANTESSEKTETDKAFVPTYFVQTGSVVEYINESGELEGKTNLENNEVATEVRNVDGESRIYYYSTTPDDLFSEVINGYGYAVGEKKTKVASFNQTGPTYFSTPYLSPDAGKIVMEGGYAGDGRMGDIHLYNTETGEGAVLYDSVTEGDDRDLFRIVGWLDNSTVLVQEQTCRECDGPTKPILHKLNVDSGELSPLFNEEDNIESLQWASVFIDGGKIYLFGGDYGKVFDGFEQDFAPDELHEIDATSGESRLISTFDSDVVTIANVDSGIMYLTLKDIVPTDAEDAPFQSIEGNRDFSEPQLVSVSLSDGSKTQVSIETKHFTNRSSAQSVVITETGLLILSNTSFTEDIDGIRYSGGNYALFQLPNTDGETELKLIKEHKTVYDENSEPMRLIVAQ